jgi:predicted TIM-barrel fold metal-dependent hydrolase
MTPDQFIQEAERRLNKDPKSRLSPKVNTALNNPGGCIFDTHCHIFDRGCIDESYFLLRFARESLGLEHTTSEDAKQFTQKALKEKGIKSLTQTEAEIYEGHQKGKQYDWSFIEAEINKAVQDSPPLEGFSVGGLWRTLRNIIFKKDMRGILEYYLERIAIKNLPQHSGKSQITTILLMDLEAGWNKAINKNLRAQMLEVKGLMRDFPLLPYIAVDPRRATWNGEDNLYRLVLEALTGDMPFYGVKVYPSLGYLPSDERLAPIFEVCERFSIPVLTHCGGNVISTFENPIMVMEGTRARQIRGEKGDGLNAREHVAYQLNDPANWKPVLERFPNLKLNLGHFGGDFIWEDYPRRDAQNRLEVILDMMRTFEYLYTDFSFNVIEENTYDNLKKVLRENAIVRNRILFGTDFWVVMPNGNLAQAQEEFSRILGASNMNRMLVVNPHKHLFTKVPQRTKPVPST